ncbi:GlxA family transcriptional regulator [Actinokineospora enzanensis]|uniref:GlxA family transcriptional regulator n=1 Tax=Actinokineospora enzanensis TaxID=155975 RepID=UPI00035C7B20|nr:helix-turn-helix domain-containing protein [Actinokineospora enzanensis]
MAHRVAVLGINEAVGYDLTIPPQVMGAATDADGRQLYEVLMCGVDREPVRMTTGFTAVFDHGPEALATADTVIVAGTRSPGPRLHGTLPDEIAAALDRIRPGTRVMSICTGAFVLGAAGLLDGRPATTHWRYTDELRELYPRVRVNPDVLFVDDGDVLTSAGLGAGVDLCLHVVRTDFGSEAANRAARHCVVPPWREGGQAQYIDRPLPEGGSDGVAPTREWVLGRLHEPLELAAMAEHASMSVRTFSRRFRAETGLSPGVWLVQQRVRHARYLLENTDLPVDQVAERAGLGSSASLRQHLRAAIGVSPVAYRRTFRSGMPR